jgi:hypothetical protein
MKVEKFVEEYNKYTNNELKNRLLASCIKREYVPYTRKVQICTSIAKATTRASVPSQKQDGGLVELFYSDSTNRYLLFQLNILRTYTNLEFSTEFVEAIKEFELLDQYELNDKIIDIIPDREYKNFKVILDMLVDDYTVNENNFINYIDKKIDATLVALGGIEGSVFDALNNKMLNVEK